MPSPRQAQPGQFYQGVDESISYPFNWTAVGTPEAPIDFALWNLTDQQDVSTQQLEGQAAVDGDVVKSPLVTGLQIGKTYRLICRVTIDGSRVSSFINISAEL